LGIVKVQKIGFRYTNAMNTFVLLIQNTALVLRSTIKKTRLSTGVGVLLFFRLIAKTLRVYGGFFCGVNFLILEGNPPLSASGGRIDAYAGACAAAKALATCGLRRC